MRNLKPFEDLTPDELLNLTPEDIEWYKQRVALSEGVVIAPDPGEPPEEPGVVPNVNGYTVGGMSVEFGGRDAIFIDELACREVIELMGRLVRERKVFACGLDYACGYSHKFTEIPDNFQLRVNTAVAFTKAEFDRIKEDLKTYEVEKSEYSTVKTAYDKYIRERDNLCGWIQDTVREAHRRAKGRDMLVKAWQGYKELDQEAAAITFFHHAYKEQLDNFGFTANYIRDYEAGHTVELPIPAPLPSEDDNAETE